jgi:DNA-binding IclR family transcriptional regulator
MSESIKSYVKSLDRGLELLEIISRSEHPMGLPELSEMLRVERSTIYRLLGTLLSRNYVIQDSATKKYRIGLKVVELSRMAIDGSNLRVVCKPYMKQLVQETGESANLVIVTKDNNIVCMDYEASPSPLAVTNNIGTNFPPYSTAAGKAILAFSPPEVQENLLGNQKFEKFTPRTITNIQMLQIHLDQIRKSGYALDDEEHYNGVRCVSAPIFDYRHKVIGAIGISGPSARVPLDIIPAYSKKIKGLAEKISIEMGVNNVSLIINNAE